MPSRRPYRSAIQWQSLIDQQARSALNAREFCDAQDLSYASFIQLRSRLREEPAAPATCKPEVVDFVELTGTAMAAPSPLIAAPLAEDDTPVVIELSLGADITLRISRAR